MTGGGSARTARARPSTWASSPDPAPSRNLTGWRIAANGGRATSSMMTGMNRPPLARARPSRAAYLLDDGGLGHRRAG